MNKKTIGALLLAFVLLMSTMCSASAVMTTEEKSKLYQDAVRELETYLETSSSSGESLYGIRTTFELLDRFGQSQNLNYYTTVLIKLYEETYDYDMLSNLELLELDRRFQDYLNNEMKGSSLCSVEELKSYAEAREKEHSGDFSGAMECYRNCMSFFDASKRYRALREAGDEQKYNQALAMQNAGDFAGAYFLFSDIVPYRDSENRKRAIETLLGYVPASATDNLNPVTGLKVKTAGITQITLKWNASAHAKEYEVQYKQKNSNSWITAGSTKGTEFTIIGLSSSENYDFRVTAAIDKIKASAASLSVRTEAKPTATPKPTPKPTAKPTPAPKPTVGGYVTFGRYEQDNNTGNGKEPIEWLVLDYDAANHRVLLLSRYGLDAKPYNDVGITWQRCSLRIWLNGEFKNNAFSKAEQNAILTTTVDNGKSQGSSRWDTNGGNNTQDKIFLLSYAEANKYFGVTLEGYNNIKSRVTPTAYAIKQGASTSSSYKTADGTAAWWWWLRSPGRDELNAAEVNSAGSLSYCSVRDGSGCVRPALWINLESDIF